MSIEVDITVPRVEVIGVGVVGGPRGQKGDPGPKGDSGSTRAVDLTDATVTGKALMTAADAATARTALGLGNSATRAVGTAAGTVAAGDDSRLSDPRTPVAHTHPVAQVTGLGDAATKNVGTTAGTVAAGDDSRMSNPRTPTAHTHPIGDVTGLSAALATSGQSNAYLAPTVDAVPSSLSAGSLVVLGTSPVTVPFLVGTPSSAGTSGAAATNITSIVCNAPTATLLAGDLLVAFAWCSLYSGESGDITSPGWVREGLVRPATIAESNRLPSVMTREVTDPASVPTTFTFTSPAACNRMSVLIVVVRADGRRARVSNTLRGTSESPYGAPLAWGRKALTLSTPTSEKNLVLDVYQASVNSGQASTAVNIDSPGAGSTLVGTVVTGTDTAYARTVTRVGQRVTVGSKVDRVETYQTNINTVGISAYQVAFAIQDVKSPTPVVQDWPWTLVYEENWDTAVAEGGWAASTYNSKYPTYDGVKTTNNGSGTYRRACLSVHDGTLDVHNSYVGGEYRCAAVLLGPNGYTGQKYGRFEAQYKVSPYGGYKAAPLLWPNDPDWAAKGLASADAWTFEIDYPEVSSFQAANPILANHYAIYPTGVSKWSGFEDIGYVLADGLWHTYAIEWTPDMVVYYRDGVLIGRSSGKSPDVPMRWTIQIETIIGATPATTDDGHFYVGKVRVWSYTPRTSSLVPAVGELTQRITEAESAMVVLSDAIAAATGRALALSARARWPITATSATVWPAIASLGEDYVTHRTLGGTFEWVQPFTGGVMPPEWADGDAVVMHPQGVLP